MSQGCLPESSILNSTMDISTVDELSLESAWDIARRLYNGDEPGSTPSLREIDFVGLTDVREALQKAERIMMTSQNKHRFSAVLDTFLSRLEAYGEAIDILAQTSTLIFSPIWGSLRVLIQVRCNCPVLTWLKMGMDRPLPTSAATPIILCP